MDKGEPRKSRIGRPKGSLNRRTVFAREWGEKFGVDPYEFLIRMLFADTIECTKADANGNAVLGADGKPVLHLVVVPLEIRRQCAVELLPYTHPRLQATQVQARVDSTVEVDLDMTKLLSDPEAARAAQVLALKMIERPDDAALDHLRRGNQVVIEEARKR